MWVHIAIVVVSLLYLHISDTSFDRDLAVAKVCPGHTASCKWISCSWTNCNQCMQADGQCVNMVNVTIAPVAYYADVSFRIFSIFALLSISYNCLTATLQFLKEKWIC